ncbi:uncharacterized protein M6B38_408700 [Iris pallida]|uniref:Uncharacterized protein n=1 Tax=Iris pallida TaxID=29817 RepID=A0AAX6FNZ6_IRIPA|nr:uncharacterized protein M6B38_408950 [Iris pallida]KAJ6817998.1 uncharacterized protein M6B38_408700 [Iris pallida]
MPGPGPHTMYALGAGAGLLRASRGRFGPHHCLFYAANSFLGPDLGSFAEWLSDTFPLLFSRGLGSAAMGLVHHPFYYVLLLGLPLSFLYSSLSRMLLKRGVLDTLSGAGLSRWQCFLLVSAGSLSHFFLDHLFEENGHSSMYTWILSTGWWNGRAPINVDSVVVVGLLCSSLIGGFIYINRVKQGESVITKSNRTLRLILIIACLYCLWCVSQIYWRDPPQPAVGEEADLGVLVFLGIYFFLPYCLCILSMNPKEDPSMGTSNQLLPL